MQSCQKGKVSENYNSLTIHPFLYLGLFCLIIICDVIFLYFVYIRKSEVYNSLSYDKISVIISHNIYRYFQ